MGAQMLGMGRDLGSLREGKLADLVVLDANPLDNIEHSDDVAFVMKGGYLYQGDTLDEVWPEANPFPRQWWWDQDPGAE